MIRKLFERPDRVRQDLRVRGRLVGRGAAGKTGLLTAVADGVLNEFFPESGFSPGYSDPLISNEERVKREKRLEITRKTGVPQTLERSTVSFELLEGAKPLVAVDLVDEVGQDFTNTKASSDEDSKTRFREVQNDLSRADVAWIITSCPPPEFGPRHQKQLAKDIGNALENLRAAVTRRPPGRPIPVGLVLTKADRIADSAEEARSLMADDMLRQFLAPLVNFCRVADQVADCAIFPTSSFGFGNSVPGKNQADRRGGPENSDAFEGNDPGDLIRDPHSIRPFNLQPLVAWSLMAGLKHQDVLVADDGPTPEAVRIARLLARDIESMDRWIVTVKG